MGSFPGVLLHMGSCVNRRNQGPTPVPAGKRMAGILSDWVMGDGPGLQLVSQSRNTMLGAKGRI